MNPFCRVLFIILFGLLFPILACSPSPFPNPAPLAVVEGEYKLPASIDPSVTDVMETELWAHVWRPAAGGPYPLIVFLHGNHGTCGRFDAGLGIRIDDRIDYTLHGTCPDRYEVTPNHRGYDYLARPLAGWGYVVLSINANRGINAAPGQPGDGGLNLRRGRLVLRHLEQLAQWNKDGGALPSLGFELTGAMDFFQVGLMGHSRGGEGMRAAMAQYHDPASPWPGRIGPVVFRSLFEIGPVDGQTGRILDAPDVFWNVLLPACDGDVSDLQGIKPFDRMLQNTGEARPYSKSTFQVFGANHNFYNTEWQQSDAESCVGQVRLFPDTLGSPEQRETSLHTLIPFFRSHTGLIRYPALARRFDPGHGLPAALTAITTYARGYSPAPSDPENFILDDFDKPTGISSRETANQSSGLTQYEHGRAGNNQDDSQRAAAIQWDRAGGFLQVNAVDAGGGMDVRRFRTLEFRVMLRCFGDLCGQLPDPRGDLDFSIALVGGNAGLSKRISLASRAAVWRPCGAHDAYWGDVYNEVFQTVRIPLSAFAGVPLAHFQGVRFIFDRTESSSIYLGNVRLTRTPAPQAALADVGAIRTRTAVQGQSEDRSSDRTEINEIASIRIIGAAANGGLSGRRGAAVEIEVVSTRPFPVADALPELRIGKKTFTLSRFSSGATDRLIFTLEASQFRETAEGAPVILRIGGRRPWTFGPLRKGMAGQ